MLIEIKVRCNNVQSTTNCGKVRLKTIHEMLSTTSRPTATGFSLIPLTRRVAFLPATGRTVIYTTQSWTPVISFGATKPPAHPEDGDGVTYRNVVKTSHPEPAVCQGNFD